MSITSDVRDAVNDWGTWCEVQAEGEPESRRVFMVIRAEGQGSLSVRSALFSMIDARTQRRGAGWGYGLIMATDAPQGMNEKIRLTVTDSLGRRWSLDAARAIMDRDEHGNLAIAAWRMALWNEQRMVVKNG